MRVAHMLLRSAAAAGMVSLAAACVVPPAGVAPRPQEAELPAPDVAFYSFDQAAYGAGSNILTYSTTRDAYTAAFEVDQSGHVRVLSPSTPRADGRSTAGKSYVVFPVFHSTDREFLSPSTDFSRVPFIFVLTSDTPLDLSAFGTGREWSRELTSGARDPDSTVAEIARRVLPDAPAYGSDFAYVGPELRAGEQAFAADCARPVEDVHDYSYYRDLWAVFTPADQRLSYDNNWLFSPALSWSSYDLLPLAAYRSRFATAAFYGSCSADPYGYGFGSSLAYGAFPAAGLLGGYGVYGFGYGYPIGYGVVTARTNGQPAGVALHLPRTPNGLGTLQVVGTAPTTGSPATGALANGTAPTRFAWRSFEIGHRPGEVQPTSRATLSERLPWVERPSARRGFEQTPAGYGAGYGGARMPSGHAMPDMRQNPGGNFGHQAVRASAPTSAPAAAAGSRAPASSPAPSSGSGSSAKSGRAQ